MITARSKCVSELRLLFRYPVRVAINPIIITVGWLNEETFRWEYLADTTTRYPVRLFHRGDEYRFWRLFRTDLHLFGVDAPATIHLLGTDELGRDMLTGCSTHRASPCRSGSAAC